MPEIRTLLRDAAPTPAVPDFRSLRTARVRRRVRRRFASLAVVVTVVLVGLGVATATSGSGPASVQTTDHRAVEPGHTRLAVPSHSNDVALDPDGEQVWVIEAGSPHGPASRIDPGTGAVTAVIETAGEVDHLAVGLGYVWAWGGDHGTGGGVTAIDPRTSKVAFSVGWGAPGFDPTGLAFADGAAWMTLPDGVVARLEIGSNRVEYIFPFSSGRVADPVVTASGLWVRQPDKGTISRIDLGTRKVTATEQWDGPLLATSGAGIWTIEAGRLVELFPELLGKGISVAEGRRLQLPNAGRAVTDVQETKTGVWVAQSGSVSRFGPGDAHGPGVTFSVGDGFVYLAVDGDSTWYVDSAGSRAEIDRWTPAGN